MRGLIFLERKDLRCSECKPNVISRYSEIEAPLDVSLCSFVELFEPPLQGPLFRQNKLLTKNFSIFER